VVAVALPDQAAMAAGKTGETFQLMTLGATTTAPDGSWTVNANPAALPADYVGPDGRINVEVVAADRTREIRWDYTTAPAAAPAGTAAALLAKTGPRWKLAGSTAATPSDLQLDLGAGTAWDKGSDPATFVGENGRPVGATGRSATASTQVSSRGPQVAAAKRAVAAMRKSGALTASAASGETVATSVVAAAPCAGMWSTWHRNLREHFLNVYAWSGS
jgi:hypothetical protein